MAEDARLVARRRRHSGNAARPAVSPSTGSPTSRSRKHAGLAFRASARYQLAKHWSVEPYYVHWRVSSSPVSDETVTYTVNGITAHEQLRAYEPLNFTRELGVKLGIRF